MPIVGSRARAGSTWLSCADDEVDGTAFLRAQVHDLDDLDVYLCGPGPWMDSARADLDRLGLDRAHIHFENFTI